MLPLAVAALSDDFLGELVPVKLSTVFNSFRPF
jgi:hypothetical protein